MLLAAFRLAFHFHRPVTELNMSLRQFYTWLAYLKIEPPEQSANHRTAMVLAQITNTAGRTLPDKKFVSADDFLGQKKQQTAAEQIAFMKSLGKN